MVAARPQLKAKGLSEKRGRALSYSAPAEDGSVKTASEAADDPYAGRRSERALPLRLRQEVQDVPRAARGLSLAG